MAITRTLEKMVLIVAVLGLHCLLFEAGVGGADGWSYFANLQSLVDDHDLDLTNNRLTFPPDYVAQPYMEGLNGRWVTHEPLGATFFQVPFYVIGKAAAKRIGPHFKIDKSPYSTLDGATVVEVFSMVLANNFWSIAAILLLFAALARAGIGEWPAFWAALFCFLGGPLHWYATVGLSHAVSCFCTALVLYLFLRAIQSKGRAKGAFIFLTGLTIGLASTVRYTDGLMLFPFMLYFVVENIRNPVNLIREEALLGLGCCATVWITFAYWKVQFGGFLAHPHAEGHEYVLTLFPPPLMKILFSAEHGFFVFNPVFLFAGIGFLWMFVRRREVRPELARWSAVSLLCFCAVAFVYDSYVEWQGHGTYSTRFLTNGVILMAPGLAYLFDRVSRKRLCYALAGVAVGFSYCLFLLSRARLIDQRGNPASVGLSIWDYTYVFREHIPLGEAARRIVDGTITLKLLASKPSLMLLAGLAGAVCAGLAVGYVRFLRPRWMKSEVRTP